MKQPPARALFGPRTLQWVGAPLRRQCEADIAEAGRRRGIPLPSSAPKIAVRRHTDSDTLRLPLRRRRIVAPRPSSE